MPDVLRSHRRKSRNPARLQIGGGSVATIFPEMMRTHLVAHRVTMVVVCKCGGDCSEHRDGCHRSKNDFFMIGGSVS